MRLSGNCPRCGELLVRRTRKRDGNPFLSCSGFPDCKFAEGFDPQVNRLADEITKLRGRVAELEGRGGAGGETRTST
jgi:ssDNA-binding Zn-finger/Zn-ribbon topoisomerase 1